MDTHLVFTVPHTPVTQTKVQTQQKRNGIPSRPCSRYGAVCILRMHTDARRVWSPDEVRAGAIRTTRPCYERLHALYADPPAGVKPAYVRERLRCESKCLVFGQLRAGRPSSSMAV